MPATPVGNGTKMTHFQYFLCCLNVLLRLRDLRLEW
jgi:hypothetical protein